MDERMRYKRGAGARLVGRLPSAPLGFPRGLPRRASCVVGLFPSQRFSKPAFMTDPAAEDRPSRTAAGPRPARIDWARVLRVVLGAVGVLAMIMLLFPGTRRPSRAPLWQAPTCD